MWIILYFLRTQIVWTNQYLVLKLFLFFLFNLQLLIEFLERVCCGLRFIPVCWLGVLAELHFAFFHNNFLYIINRPHRCYFLIFNLVVKAVEEAIHIVLVLLAYSAHLSQVVSFIAVVHHH